MNRHVIRIATMLAIMVIAIGASATSMAERTADTGLNYTIHDISPESSLVDSYIQTVADSGTSLIERVLYALYEIMPAEAIWAIYLAYLSEPGGSDLKACNEIRRQSCNNQDYVNNMNQIPDLAKLCGGFKLEYLPEPSPLPLRCTEATL